MRKKHDILELHLGFAPNDHIIDKLYDSLQTLTEKYFYQY